ncbi:hypothetical protein GF373_07620 [bacterium]|nr:hypothetical protein [bacterium]
MPQLVILSGPSCIGKSPLEKALRRFYPEWGEKLERLVLFNDRAPRPGERDGVEYHFRSHKEVITLREQEGYIVIPVRDDMQALEIESIQQIIDRGKIAFFEGNPYIVAAMRDSGLFERFETVTIFLSPLAKAEIQFLRQPERHVDLEKFVSQVMRKKQLRRKQKQMQILSQPDLADVETRCTAAYQEMLYAWRYEYVIPNHDGEDSEHWSDFYFPLGDARKALDAFVSILNGNPCGMVEKWEKNLLA